MTIKTSADGHVGIVITGDGNVLRDTNPPGRQRRDDLHGDLVAYGALVQLMLDGQADKARELRAFLVSLGTPVTLAEMNVPLDKAALHDALVEATTGPDMAHIPYPITQDMVFEAMQRVEAL